jgi:hypothetical protein
MSRSAQEIVEEARQLPPDEVDWIVESLLIKDKSPAEAQIEAAWDSEIKRRMDEIDSGAVEMIPQRMFLLEWMQGYNQGSGCEAGPGPSRS